jgi:VWFA-related protein
MEIMFRRCARNYGRAFGLILWSVLLSAAGGQSGGPLNVHTPPVAASLSRSTFRLDVNLIQVPVSVTDIGDRPVLGLPKSAFRVFEDNVEQPIAAFSMADGPASTGFVFDGSKSMRTRMDQSRAAVNQYFATSVSGDQFQLVRFSDRAELMTPWTRDAEEILRAVSRVRPDGWTAMVDGIRLSVEQMRRASNSRRVILVLSDGGDNNSRYSESELMSIVRESDVSIWAIGLFERQRYLQRLADETGGRVVWVHKLAELPGAMEKLSLQIRNQYAIGYFSTRAKDDGRYHKIRIEVVPPDGMKTLHATWRQGYIAP